MNHNTFFFVLQSDLKVRLTRDVFERHYLKIKDLPHAFDTFPCDEHIRYEVDFRGLTGFKPELKLLKIKRDWHYHRDRYEEDIIKRGSIMLPGTVAEFRGRIEVTGNTVILDDAQLKMLP